MYQIVIKKKAKKFIDRLPLNEKKRVVAAIERLPNGEDIKKLKGHADLLRLRVGEYRIIYTVDHGELSLPLSPPASHLDFQGKHPRIAVDAHSFSRVAVTCSAMDTRARPSASRYSILVSCFSTACTALSIRARCCLTESTAS